MRLLEATGRRPSQLEQLINALLSIPPLLVETEQAFSAAKLFATKLRLGFSDKSVHSLSFLRSHYKK